MLVTRDLRIEEEFRYFHEKRDLRIEEDFHHFYLRQAVNSQLGGVNSQLPPAGGVTSVTYNIYTYF